MIKFDEQTIRQFTSNLHFSRLLGRGSFANVFRGTLGVADLPEQFQGLPKQFAAKISSSNISLRERKLSASNNVRGLEEELQVLASCTHPNLCRLFAVCLAPDLRCLIYDLCEHGRLTWSKGTYDPCCK